MQQYNEQPELLLAKHGKSFHWAGLILGTEQLNNAKKIYAFCRYVDDVVDNCKDKALALHHTNKIKYDLKNRQSDETIISNTIDLIADLGIPIKIIYDLIDGVCWDLFNETIYDKAELLKYSYGVAGTVGLLMCYILGVQDKKAYPFAIDLGIAMQLTNIARDVMTDAKLGRIYIPQTWLTTKISCEDILNRRHQSQLYTHVCKILELAQTYYDSADKGLVYLPFRARASIVVASRVYHEIGSKILKLGQQKYFKTDRVFTTKPHKLLVTMRALSELTYRPQMYRKNKTHDTYLHRSLKTVICYE